MKFNVVIPARFASTRLAAKALADIAGKPMIVRVAERATQSTASSVCIATDHVAIRDVVEAHGYTAIMTREDHVSGTDRIAEVAAQLGWSDEDIVVNVQGDEPLIEPAVIDQVARELNDAPDAAVSTACHAIRLVEDFLNPNVVKVVCDDKNYALYFSRAPIPYPRDTRDASNTRDIFANSKAELALEVIAFRHIGIYGYRVGFLRQYGALTVSPLERIESLEQLRVLWHGFKIRVAKLKYAPEAGVDTAEDLERVRHRFLKK